MSQFLSLEAVWMIYEEYFNDSATLCVKVLKIWEPEISYNGESAYNWVI